MEYFILPLAVLGFVFGISAYTQIKSLKKKIEKLEREIKNLKK